MQYKCIPAHGHLTIDNNGNFDDAVRSYANLINNQATANWEFHSLETITITQNPGCLSGLLYNIPIIGNLFGKPPITKYCNMFIFSKNNNENKINKQYEEQKINEKYEVKKCKQCGRNVFSGRKTCQYCGGEIYIEIIENDDQ